MTTISFTIVYYCWPFISSQQWTISDCALWASDWSEA